MALAQDGRPLHLSWDYSREEILADAFIHCMSLVFSLAGAITLGLRVIFDHQGLTAFDYGVLSYAVAFVSTMCVSAIYNLYPVSPLKWLLRRIDHSLIYCLILTTYYPIYTLTHSDLIMGIYHSLFVSLGVLGVYLKLFMPGRYEYFSIILYTVLGCSGFIFYDELKHVLNPEIFLLFKFGGIAFCIGLLFHMWQKLIFQNAIWHACVLIGTICHYFAMLNLITSVYSG